MTLSIKEQFDLSHPEIYYEGNTILNSGLFLTGVDKYIGVDIGISIRVLKLITQGRVNLFNQERIFSWIDKLHHKVKRKNNDPLSIAFFEAMQSLTDKTDGRFKRRGYKSKFNREDISQYYGIGGDSGAIFYGSRILRFLANREAFKHIGDKFGLSRNQNTVDFPAKLRIFITNPKDSSYANNYSGHYESGMTINRIDGNCWEVLFDEYFLSTHHEYLWNLNLWSKIFFAIKPLMSELFEAEIIYKKENQFND